MPFCIGKAAHRPECGGLHTLRVRRHVDDEVRCGDAERTDRRAREHEFYRRDAAVHPREHENGERRKDRPEESAARHTERDSRRPDEDRERRTDGRARGDAEDERLCERVLHTRLHDDTRKCQSRSRCHCEQDARHAQ